MSLKLKKNTNHPTLSQQLMMLRKSDVVSTRRDGKQIFYSIKDDKDAFNFKYAFTSYIA